MQDCSPITARGSILQNKGQDTGNNDSGHCKSCKKTWGPRTTATMGVPIFLSTSLMLRRRTSRRQILVCRMCQDKFECHTARWQLQGLMFQSFSCDGGRSNVCVIYPVRGGTHVCSSEGETVARLHETHQGSRCEYGQAGVEHVEVVRKWWHSLIPAASTILPLPGSLSPVARLSQEQRLISKYGGRCLTNDPSLSMAITTSAYS